jgi:phosphatidylinositol alpha-1,6-mannosyltransferase
LVERNAGILGLFTEHGLHGGIQASGRVAWQGILQQPHQEFTYFCYGEPGSNLSAIDPPSLWDESNGKTYFAKSRASAIKLALSHTWRVNSVFVWHLNLLKLVPFMRVPKAKSIVFLHGIEAWRKLPWLDQQALKRVNLFLSNSDFTWQRFLQFNPSFCTYPHLTIPLGIGQEYQGTTPDHGKTPVTLMISRLEKSEAYKGHRELILAWPQVLHKIPNAELRIIGTGNLKDELVALVQQLGLVHRVKLLGWVEEAQKQTLLENCMCLALPSRAEGFGLVYLEAMRIGRPCLVSVFDAAREVVNPPEAGLAVDPTNQIALVDALCRLMTPGKQWDMWTIQARNRYSENFTAARFQKRLAGVFNG